MELETTTLTRKNKFVAWQTIVMIERTPIVLSEVAPNRWLETLRDHVVAVVEMKITGQDAKYPSANPPYNFGYEVTFKNGAIGFVGKGAQQDLDALVVDGVGYFHGLAVWKKRGHTVGYCVAWMGTKHNVRGKLFNVDRLRKCCALELYKRAAGETWG